MSELLTKWLAYYDPLFFGATFTGVVHGVGLMLGVGGWCQPGGMHVLYRGSSRVSIDYDTPVGAAGPGVSSITLFPWITHDADTSYYYTCLPIGAGGVAAVPNSKTPQIVRVRIDGEGDAMAPAPMAPRNLRVTPVAAGAFRISWTYPQTTQAPAPSTFNIYTNGGSGDVDYESSIATVTARLSGRGAGCYGWISSAYDHATRVTFAVRAEDSDGDEDQNVAVASAVADAEGPSAAEIVAASYGDDE